jgi:RNA polymerase sigma-70 factor (ECF subfamily)
MYMEQKDFKEKLLPARDGLLRQARRMLGNDAEAEDIVQEAYLKLWSIRHTLDRYDSPPALASRIIHNLCLNRLQSIGYRQERLGEVSLQEADAATAASPDSLLEQKESAERLQRLIDSLPDTQRNILRMKHAEGMEVDEIAALIGSNPDAVRMNLSRARRRVRDAFLQQEQYKRPTI